MRRLIRYPARDTVLAKFDDMLKQLVAEPSISSTTADIDRICVIEHWQLARGFGLCDRGHGAAQPTDKANLIATLGANGKPIQVAWCWRDIPTPYR